MSLTDSQVNRLYGITDRIRNLKLRIDKYDQLKPSKWNPARAAFELGRVTEVLREIETTIHIWIEHESRSE